MCDYSLEAYQSRPASVGEKVTLGRFHSGSMGFAAPASVTKRGEVKATMACAVCIPAESKLLIEGIDKAVQQKYGIGAVEEVKMTRLEGSYYKDAVIFHNGQTARLQDLNVGVSAAVMTYGPETAGSTKGNTTTPLARTPELV